MRRGRGRKRQGKERGEREGGSDLHVYHINIQNVFKVFSKKISRHEKKYGPIPGKDKINRNCPKEAEIWTY